MHTHALYHILVLCNIYIIYLFYIHHITLYITYTLQHIYYVYLIYMYALHHTHITSRIISIHFTPPDSPPATSSVYHTVCQHIRYMCIVQYSIVYAVQEQRSLVQYSMYYTIYIYTEGCNSIYLYYYILLYFQVVIILTLFLYTYLGIQLTIKMS